MRSFFHALVLLCVLATPAMAQDGHWYMGLKGGVDAGPTAEAAGQGASVDLDTEAGFAALWTLGYAFQNFRIESEVAWRRNDLDTATLGGGARFGSTGTSTAPAVGRLRNFSYMLNGLYTFGGDGMAFTPFVLGGIGFSQVEAELVRIGSQDYDFDDDDTAFAYQVGAGVEYPIYDDLFLEVAYRFFGTPTVTFDDVDVQNTHHTGIVGLTLAF